MVVFRFMFGWGFKIIYFKYFFVLKWDLDYLCRIFKGVSWFRFGVWVLNWLESWRLEGGFFYWEDVSEFRSVFFFL